MLKQRHSTIWFMIGLLLLAAMACQLGSTVEATPTPFPVADTPVPPPETVVPPTTAPAADEPVSTDKAEPLPQPTAASEVTIQDLQFATVQILAQKEVNGRMQTQWTGSGTIISADGLILTNAHVAAPTAPGLAILYSDPELLFSEEPDVLVVALVEAADRPPVATYVAELLAADGVLDLAVIRVQTTMDGTAVDHATLNLPFLAIGDSNNIGLGDEVRVLGFPGAGGETITFTRGDVSGFESQDRVGDRAWIKTDTTVSPGNSGGLGANVTGQVIGVPSFVIEATGGAINRLRSVNLAKPLIEAAQTGVVYESPFIVGGTGDEELSLVTWAEDFDEADNCAIGPVKAYSSDALAAVAIFNYQGMTDGEQLLVVWFADDELISATVVSWQDGSEGNCFPVYVHNYGEPVPEGTYVVELYVGADLDFVGTAEISVGGAVIAAGGVQIEGTITDADTGKPINEAVIFILNPGADLDAWMDDPQDADIFSFAETDAQGKYRLPDSLERGVSYPGVAAATGYRPNDGFLNIEADDPDLLIINLELSK